MIDWHLLNKNKIKDVFQEFGANKHCVWYYYNTKYRLCLLINLFFWEYIYAIIGENNIKFLLQDCSTAITQAQMSLLFALWLNTQPLLGCWVRHLSRWQMGLVVGVSKHDRCGFPPSHPL